MNVGREAECGPLATVDPDMNCIAVHLYDGYIKCIPINPYREKVGGKGTGNAAKGNARNSKQGPAVLGESFYVRLDQQTLLSMTFLYDTPSMTSKGLIRLAILHQDSRGYQHLITHIVDVKARELRPCKIPSNVTSGNAKGTMTVNVNATLTSSGLGGVSTATQQTQHQQQLLPQGPKKSRIDAGSCIIIPLPLLSSPVAAAAAGPAADSKLPAVEDASTDITGTGGGLIVIGQMQITYVSNTGSGSKVLPIEPTVFLCYCVIPQCFISRGSYRFLLGDDRGFLFVLDVSRDERSGIVTGLHMETLGVTSIPSAISYMSNSLVFVGSRYGDSQLLQLHSERDSETNSYVEIVEEYTNLGPIVDFDLVDFDRKGQCQVVTCSGTGKDGSIRVVRNGIGIHEQANVEIPGIKGMWNLRASFHDTYDKYLVQSFINETRILAILDDEMEETSIEGFQADAATLYAGNIVQNLFVQVTESKLILVDCTSCLATCFWMPDDGSRITVASGNSSGQIVIALRGGIVMYFIVEQIGNGKHAFKVQGTKKLDQEVSCINLNPFDDILQKQLLRDPSTMDIDDVPGPNLSSKSKLVVVGLWNDFSVRILDLDEISLSLNELVRLDLGGDTQARSLMLATLEGSQRMLLVGLGDGQLISYFLQGEDGGKLINVTSRKKVSLGTQSISLCAFRNASNGNTCIFASGDRPTVVYMNGGKVLYSNINLSTESGKGAEEVVNWVCPFHCELFPDCLCLASEEALRIGTIDDIQKLHVQTFPMKDSPRRIAHHRDGRMFAVGCMNCGEDGISGSVNQGNVLYFLDDGSLEEVHR